LFAKKDIKDNEEIRYDYGVKDLPWRVKGISKSLMSLLDQH